MTDFLNRSTVDIEEVKGRTLSGIAVPWDTVARVRDQLENGRASAPYLEAFAPESTDVSRAQHATFPLFAASHDARQEPIGTVTFSRSREALMFDAPISETPRGNDHLQLANDGAERSVSVQFRPIRHVARRFAKAAGTVLYRTEVGLRHLSLVPTGYGQYEGATVQSIRSEFGEMGETIDEVAEQHRYLSYLERHGRAEDIVAARHARMAAHVDGMLEVGRAGSLIPPVMSHGPGKIGAPVSKQPLYKTRAEAEASAVRSWNALTESLRAFWIKKASGGQKLSVADGHARGEKAYVANWMVGVKIG